MLVNWKKVIKFQVAVNQVILKEHFINMYFIHNLRSYGNSELFNNQTIW
jgi:hypothetical protein